MAKFDDTYGILLLINLIVDMYAFRYSLLSTINMLTNKC